MDLTAQIVDGINGWLRWAATQLLSPALSAIGGVRYVIAAGNPRMMDEGKAAIRSALLGYALAALAPMLVDILRRVIGAA